MPPALSIGSWRISKYALAYLLMFLVILTFVVLYSIERFAMPFLRHDCAPLLGPPDSTQLIRLAALLLSVGWHGVLLLRDRRSLPPTAQEP